MIGYLVLCVFCVHLGFFLVSVVSVSLSFHSIFLDQQTSYAWNIKQREGERCVRKRELTSPFSHRCQLFMAQAPLRRKSVHFPSVHPHVVWFQLHTSPVCQVLMARGKQSDARFLSYKKDRERKAQTEWRNKHALGTLFVFGHVHNSKKHTQKARRIRAYLSHI
jgi:hypothetical protein